MNRHLPVSARAVACASARLGDNRATRSSIARASSDSSLLLQRSRHQKISDIGRLDRHGSRVVTDSFRKIPAFLRDKSKANKRHRQRMLGL